MSEAQVSEVPQQVENVLLQGVDLDAIKTYLNSGFHPQISFILDCKKVKLEKHELEEIIDLIKGVQLLMPAIEIKGKKYKLVFETFICHEDRDAFNSTGLQNFFYSKEDIGFGRGVITLELINNDIPAIGDLLDDIRDYMYSEAKQSIISSCFKISWEGCESD